MSSLDTMAKELSAIRAGVRDAALPFNVNFFCHTPPAPNAQREAAWRTALSGYYDELGVASPAGASGAGRAPFSAEAAEALAYFKPRVVSFHFGLPSGELIARVKAWGAKVLSSATTVDEARWLEAHGADAIIAQGFEAGGHRGMFLSDDITTQIGTFALLPQVTKAVRVPVIAAGGIADARGVRTALELGAAAVQLGTSYLLCPEATTSAIHRAALQSEAAQRTALTNVFTGRPARSIVNRLVREQGPMSDRAPAFPLAATAVAPLRAKAESQGSDDFSPLWSGQNPTGCKNVPAGTLTRELAGLA
jgi:nitronate monooxygenase